mmetsp:Transcript_5412/g.16109  ORF Transcript_5412/g.16109 Transcript_5412/m.16109 type:complete len:469 (+) Transcript_5412:516-1922(+)
MLPWARKAAAVTCRVSRRHLRPKSGGAPHAVAAAAERRSSLTSSASEVARRSEVHAGWTRERMSEAGRRSACVATAAGAATATALSSACAGVVGGLLAPALRRDTASRSASARRLLSRCCAAGGRSGERLLLSPPSFDLLAFANGILGGLVGITAGCASIDLGLAAAVGVVSGVVFSSASEATSRWGVDDVVDAFAVHGACGVWGLLAVGLFDRGGGLLPTGSGRLLGSQALGALVLAALGCGGAAAAAGTLRWLGVLRVSREQEESGLDSEFGLKAYSRNTDVLQRCRTVSALLSENGFSALDLFDALVSLRGVVYRTFTPQAADHKLEGEVKGRRSGIRILVSQLAREGTLSWCSGQGHPAAPLVRLARRAGRPAAPRLPEPPQGGRGRRGAHLRRYGAPAAREPALPRVGRAGAEGRGGGAEGQAAGLGLARLDESQGASHSARRGREQLQTTPSVLSATRDCRG